MPPRAEDRPPSEQTVEHQLLDAVATLQQRLDDLASRPPLLVASNWWDEIPGEVREQVQEGIPAYVILPAKVPSTFLELRVHPLADRLEVTLRINGGWIVWQRALFYGRPARMTA